MDMILILSLLHVLEREYLTNILSLVVCYRFELNRISFYAVSIDDIV